ncbi:MAG: hypothetical protein AMXMBFR84_35490 [Candidatus Hydrogenedentota bacterium]
MRTILTVTFRLSLGTAVCSLFFLLFKLGHTEVAPTSETLLIAAVAAISALIAGFLQWVGLPTDKPLPEKRKGPKKPGPARQK